MSRDLDEQVESFRARPLDQGPYTFVAADALVLKVRENGRVMNVHALLGINRDGHREILGVDVSSGEDKAGWLTSLPRPGRPRIDRGQVGDLRRACRSRGVDRGDTAWCIVATLSNPLHGELDVDHPEGTVAWGCTLDGVLGGG